jgi:predicted site-specific integrase-resolvase
LFGDKDSRFLLFGELRGDKLFKKIYPCIPNYTGRLPIPAEQLPTGTVIVHPPEKPTVEAVALYARVSSADQKADLERQLGRLVEYASKQGLTVIRSVAAVLTSFCARLYGRGAARNRAAKALEAAEKAA